MSQKSIILSAYKKVYLYKSNIKKLNKAKNMNNLDMFEKENQKSIKKLF